MAVNHSGLTDKQLETLSKALKTKLTGLTAEIRELEAILTDEESDEKGAPDEIDRSSFEEEMQRTQLVLDGKKHLQSEIVEALERIKDGTYGICEESEEPIGFKRLSAQPWTRLSLEAQQDLEQRRKNQPQRAASAAYPSVYGGGSDEGGGASGGEE